MLNCRNTSRIFSYVTIRVGTKGKRSLFSIKPIIFNILFAPAGFPSTNNRLNSSGYKTVSYTVAIANAAGNLTYAFPDMEEGSDTQ